VSDQELRALERRFRETGSAADEEVLLRARIRLGSVTTSRLVVAALCGDAVARRLLPAGREGADREALATLCGITAATVTKWTRLRGCPHAGRGQRVRYDPCAVLPWLVERLGYSEEGDQAARLLASALHQVDPDAARRATIAASWVAVLRSPDRETALECKLVEREAALVNGTPATTGRDVPRETRSLAVAVGCAGGSTLQDARTGLESAYRVLASATHALTDARNEREAARGLRASFNRLQGALRQDVVPWALGLADPLAERVARRLSAAAEPVVPVFDEPPEAVVDPSPRTRRKKVATRQQLDRLEMLLRRKGVTENDALALLPRAVLARNELEESEAAALLDHLAALPDRDARRPE
jgi:hypothetical protein